MGEAARDSECMRLFLSTCTRAQGTDAQKCALPKCVFWMYARMRGLNYTRRLLNVFSPSATEERATGDTRGCLAHQSFNKHKKERSHVPASAGLSVCIEELRADEIASQDAALAWEADDAEDTKYEDVGRGDDADVLLEINAEQEKDEDLGAEESRL